MHQLNLLSLFRNKNIVPLMLLVSLLFSCKKDDAEPLYKNGVIEGTVSIQNYDDHSYVMIKASGPYGDQIKKVYKEENSSIFRYKFDGLGNGSYKLSAYKDSFGTVDYYSVGIFGNDTVFLPSIYLYPAVNKTSIPQSPVYESQDSYALIFNSFPITNHLSRFRFIAFMSTRSDVSDKKYQCYWYVEPYGEDKIMLYKLPSVFKKGTKIFVVIYPVYQNDSGYFNSYYGLTVFSSISPDVHSKTISVIIE